MRLEAHSDFALVVVIGDYITPSVLSKIKGLSCTKCFQILTSVEKNDAANLLYIEQTYQNSQSNETKYHYTEDYKTFPNCETGVCPFSTFDQWTNCQA